MATGRGPEYDIESVPEGDFIPPDQAAEKGYYGYTFDDRPPESDTVADVAGDTANVKDKPDPRHKKRVEDNHDALKGA